MKAISLLVCLGLLAACGGDKDLRPVFDGVPFRTDSKVVDRKVSRAVFQAEVWGVDQSLLGAREAMRFAGTQYCIENYGTSKIDWPIDLDNPEEPLPRDGDNAVLQGTCDA